jgi:hypothetical protein
MKGGAVGVRRAACVAKYARRAGTRRKRGVSGLRIENWTDRSEELGELRVKEREDSMELGTLDADSQDRERDPLAWSCRCCLEAKRAKP